MEKVYKYLALIGAIVLFLSGVFVGSKMTPEKTVEVVSVRHEKGETIYDTVKVLTPYYVRYTDTVIYTQIVEKPVFVYADTSSLRAVWDDYFLTRKYDFDFSNDSVGDYNIEVFVNRNRAVEATSRIVPVYRVVTREITRTGGKRGFVPFVSGSYSTFGVAGIGGGLFYNDLGLEYQFQKSLEGCETGHSLGLKWRF
jgi:hypothetical protein